MPEVELSVTHVICGLRIPADDRGVFGGTQRQSSSLQPRLSKNAEARYGFAAKETAAVPSRSARLSAGGYGSRRGWACAAPAAAGQRNSGSTDRSVRRVSNRLGYRWRHGAHLVPVPRGTKGSVVGLRHARGVQLELSLGTGAGDCGDLVPSLCFADVQRDNHRFAGVRPLPAAPCAGLCGRETTINSYDQCGSCPSLFRRQAIGMVRLTVKEAADV